MPPRHERVRLALAVIAIGLISIAPARAHHSFAPYEPTLQIKLSGVVTEFKWGNPHVYFEIDASDPASGAARHWLIEGASTSILNRAGWKFNMLKAGDKVTVIVSPLRNGEPAALLKRITLADGRTFSNGAAAGTATIQ
ncbi:MAG TPA: DUF6152 family protein [Vicinamibacterales bacterium]